MDMEKVIKAYEDFINGYECFCESDDYEYEMHKAVLSMLKEQEAVEPYIAGSGESFETAETWWYECGNCNKPIDPNDKFCRYCGRSVKWE
mgnify:CR=1 FL=1